MASKKVKSSKSTRKERLESMLDSNTLDDIKKRAVSEADEVIKDNLLSIYINEILTTNEVFK